MFIVGLVAVFMMAVPVEIIFCYFGLPFKNIYEGEY